MQVEESKISESRFEKEQPSNLQSRNTSNQNETIESKSKNSEDEIRAPKSSEFYQRQIEIATKKLEKAKKREIEESRQNRDFAFKTFGEMIVKCFGGDWTEVDIDKLSKFLQTNQSEIKNQCQKDPEIAADEKSSIRQIKDHLKLIKDRKKQLQKKQG